MATLSTALLATLIALGTALSSWKKMALIILVEANAWLFYCCWETFPLVKH